MAIVARTLGRMPVVALMQACGSRRVWEEAFRHSCQAHESALAKELETTVASSSFVVDDVAGRAVAAVDDAGLAAVAAVRELVGVAAARLQKTWSGKMGG